MYSRRHLQSCFMLVLLAAAPRGEELRRVVRTGNVHDVRKILDAEPEALDAADELGRTPLAFAVMDGHRKVAESLVERGAKVRKDDSNRNSPIAQAIIRGERDTAAWLFSKAADPAARPHPILLRLAAETNRPELMRLVIDQGLTPDRQNVAEAFLWAARAGATASMPFLIEKGADVNEVSNGWTPLHAAVENGHVDAVELLIRAGANVNVQASPGATPLARAVFLESYMEPRLKEKRKPLATLLLKHKADPNLGEGTQDGPPLSNAAARGDLETMELLVAHGAKLDGKNKAGRTPAHSAVLARAPQALEWLAAKGAKLDVPDADGRTPLDYAVSERREMEKVLRKLLAAKNKGGASAPAEPAAAK